MSFSGAYWLASGAPASQVIDLYLHCQQRAIDCGRRCEHGHYQDAQPFGKARRDDEWLGYCAETFFVLRVLCSHPAVPPGEIEPEIMIALAVM